MNEIPLIWTTKGNIPVESLAYSSEWFISDEEIKLVETHRLGDEIVRQSAHIYVKRSLLSDAVAQQI